MPPELKVATSFDDFTPYLDDYCSLLADYFIWNIQSRYDFNPTLFEKNATRMNTSLEALLDEFYVMKESGIMSDGQLDRLKDQFSQGQWSILLYDDENLVGMCRLYRRNSNEAEVHSVYVDPAYRGKGYGSILIDKLISIAEHESFSVLFLDTMPFMEKAIKLYESSGFEHVDYIEFPQYTPQRAKDIGVIFMKLDLS